MMEKTSKDGLEGRNGAPTFRFRVAAGSSDSSSAPWLRVNDAGVVEGLAGTCYFERDLDRSAFRTLKRGAYGFEAISTAGVRFVIYAGSASADSLIGYHISSLRTWDVAAYSTNIHKPETFFDPAVGWEASSSITTWITLVPGERAKVNWSGNGGRLAWSDTDETFSGLRDLVFGYGVYGLNAYLVPAVKKHETLHFMGWSDRETGSIIGALGSSAEVDFPYLTEREVTYYAQWGHEITWDAAGGFFLREV